MNAPSSLEVAQAKRVDRFLTAVSWVSERLGVDASPIVNLAELRAQPPGSFGHAWAKHLDDNGLQPLNKGLRRQQLHDGLHVLTGYGTDLLGEAEVQAFLLGAKFRLVHVLIVVGTLGTLKRQQRHGLDTPTLATVRSRLADAYHLGKSAQFDPDTWQPEQLWAYDLERVQKSYGMTAPSAALGEH